MKTRTLNLGPVFLGLTVLTFASVHSVSAQQIVTNIAAPSGLDLCAVNPALNKIYFASGNPAAMQMVVVDGTTFSQTGVGFGQGVDVDVSNNNYWSAGVYSDSVTVWNSSNTALGSAATGFGCAIGVSVDATHRRVWVGAQCSDSIWAFNADTRALVAGPISPGGVMGSPLVNPATGRAYFNASGSSKRVNPSTFAVTANAFGTVIGVNASANLLYAVNGTTLQIINGAPDPEVVLTNITLPYTFGSRIGVSPVLNRVYVGYNNTNILAVFNATTGQIITNVSLGAGITSVGSVVADDSRNRVYALASGGGSGHLFVIQDAAAQVLTNIVVSPSNPIIGVGSNQQFTATGHYSDGSSQVLTNGVAGSGSNWVSLAGLPEANSGVASAAVNGALYVVAGQQTVHVYAYDPAANSWTSKASLPDPYSGLAYAGAAAIGNKLYVMGGCEGSDCRIGTTAGMRVYDAVANSWSNLGSMSVTRSTMAVGAINGKVYVAGGMGACAPCTALNLLEVYDPASNTWTAAQPMPAARSHCGAAVINGKLYVVGGADGGTTFGSLMVYDPTTDTWATKMPMPTPRATLGATAVGGLLYAIDGTTASSASTNLVEVYNPATDSWSTGTPTLTGHYLAQPVAINGTIYLAGNGPQNNSITNVESYTPPIPLWSSSSPAVASITTNGVAAGFTSGVTAITATSGGISGMASLTVLSPPAISTQPTNNTVSPNGSVTLSVGATGGGLGYQWQFNGTNITGATGASLTIPNVSAATVGVYSVIVSNAAGSVTSSFVTLASVDVKMFAGVIVNGPLGSNYLIQATSNLTSGNWTTLTNVALPMQPYTFIDYTSCTNGPQFYRAVPQ